MKLREFQNDEMNLNNSKIDQDAAKIVNRKILKNNITLDQHAMNGMAEIEEIMCLLFYLDSVG